MIEWIKYAPSKSNDQADMMGAHASGLPFTKLLRTVWISAMMLSSGIDMFWFDCKKWQFVITCHCEHKN